MSEPRQPNYGGLPDPGVNSTPGPILRVPKLFVFIGILLFLVIAAVYIFQLSQAKLVMAGRQFEVELVNSEPARTNGLSGRSSLPPDNAMLFVFDTASTQCFWMKDMKFPLDIIWVDTDRRIVHIEENLSPDSYPQSFCPHQPARYVIEVNAGVVQDTGIDIGDKLSF